MMEIDTDQLTVDLPKPITLTAHAEPERVLQQRYRLWIT